MAATSRRWGWHRLDSRWAARLVADAELPEGALVLDVGAGDGVLTAALVARGARVIAVEAHHGRATALRQRFEGAVIVVEADATDLRMPRRPFRVVANPPFAITTSLLRRLLQPGSRLAAADLILQGRVARWWAGPHAPAAARWRREFSVTLGRRVPRTAFDPPPPVDARVLVIRRARPVQRR